MFVKENPDRKKTIVLKSDNVSINKSIAPEFVTMKVSQDLKLLLNMSIQ